MTAYYKTNSYNKTNHLAKTTCFKSKNIYSEDSKPADEVPLEDEIEVFRKKRVVLSPEKLEAHIERLYKENEKRQVNIEKLKNQFYSEIYTHKPETNIKSDPNLPSFYLRLNDWLSKKKVKDEERKNKENFDKTTERQLFTPDLTLTKNKKFENSRVYSPRMTATDFLHTEGIASIKRRDTLMKEGMEKFKAESEKIITST